MKRRAMHFGVFVLGTGNHSAGWRYDGAATSNNDLAVIQEIARHAERGKFDLLFVSAGSQASKPSAGMMRAGIARPESTPVRAPHLWEVRRLEAFWSGATSRRRRSRP